MTRGYTAPTPTLKRKGSSKGFAAKIGNWAEDARPERTDSETGKRESTRFWRNIRSPISSGLRGHGFMLGQYLAKLYVDKYLGKEVPGYMKDLALSGHGLSENAFK